MAQSRKSSNASSARRRQKAKELQQQAERERRKRIIRTGVIVSAVLLAIVVGIGVWNATRGTAAPTTGSSPGTACDSSWRPNSMAEALTTVPAACLDAVGVGSVSDSALQPIKDGTAQLVDGKPRVLFVGAEFCPYCAMERWPLTIALSRFGTVGGLTEGLSGADEGAASNIPTVLYTNVTYSSQHLSFTGYELSDRNRQPLQKLSDQDAALFKAFNDKGQIPFLYTGTRVQIGAGFADFRTMAGRSGTDIVAELSDPESVNAKQILGSANLLTAHFCQLTNQAPADVCTATGVVAAAELLK